MWKTFSLPWKCKFCQQWQPMFSGGWVTLVRRERYCAECCNDSD